MGVFRPARNERLCESEDALLDMTHWRSVTKSGLSEKKSKELHSRLGLSREVDAVVILAD